MSIVETPAADPVLARVSGYGLMVASVLIGIGVALSPKPGPLSQMLAVAAVIVPVVVLAVVVASPEVFEVNSRRYGRTISFALLLPVISLFFVTLATPLVNPQIGWLLGAAGMAVTVLIGLWAPPRTGLASPQVLLLFLALYGAGYGWSAPLLIDLRFDASPGQAFQAPVIGHGISSGRSGPHYYLRLGPWGPVTRVMRVSVSRTNYNAIDVGGVACVTLHPGALAMPWFTAAGC